MKRFIPALMVIVLFSCTKGEKVIYQEFKKLPENHEWARDNVLEFTMPVKDTSVAYHHMFGMKFTEKFPLKYLHVKIEVTSPSGETENHLHRLLIRNDERELLAKKVGDTWVHERPLHENKKFNESGNWTFKVKQKTVHEKLFNCKEMGMLLKVPSK